MGRVWAKLVARLNRETIRRALDASKQRWLHAGKLRLAEIRGLSELHWLTLALLWLAFFAYAIAWWKGYAPALTDPNLQTDDARTALFPFHRYAPGAPLANDPIANEMIEYQPYAFRALYRLTVPFMGVLAASKVAQAVCIAIVLGGGLVLLASRRAGAGTAALFVFLFLHDSFVMDRIGGGLPRGFGFPAIALWVAGALGHRPWARRTAAAIAALTYPSALAMVLGAEGIYTLRSVGQQGLRTSFRRVKNYGLLVLVCAMLLAPAVLFGASDGGPVHTMAQAEEEPAFSKSGRLWLLPLSEPGATFGRHFFDVFRPEGKPALKNYDLRPHGNQEDIVVLIVIALAIALPILRLTPTPAAAVTFLSSTLILYALSVGFAFRLYSPERYYSFGMRGSALSLAIGVFGLTLPRLRPKLRQPLRNLVAALVIALVWIFMGSGTPDRRRPMSMTIDYRRNIRLWEFIQKLPADARIASHINDGDDIPLFAERANNGGFETLQPWLTKSWARQRARAEDTLRALYATNRKEVFDYARKYHVTHLLLNENRYHSDFVKKSQSFEPLSLFARELLADRSLDALVLADLPREAIIFDGGRLRLVDLRRLAKAWNLEPFSAQ